MMQDDDFSVTTTKAAAEMLALHNSQQFSVRQICDRYEITPPTFYRHLEAAKGRMKGSK